MLVAWLWAEAADISEDSQLAADVELSFGLVEMLTASMEMSTLLELTSSINKVTIPHFSEKKYLHNVINSSSKRWKRRRGREGGEVGGGGSGREEGGGGREGGW